jgi:hypothetical protein
MPYSSKSCNHPTPLTTTTNLLNIANTFQVIPTPALMTSTSPFKPSFFFYVEMPHNLATRRNSQQDELVVNLEDSNLELNDLTIPN